MTTRKTTTTAKATTAKATTAKATTARQQAKAVRDADNAAQVKTEQAITARNRRNVAAAKATKVRDLEAKAPARKAPAAKAGNPTGGRKAAAWNGMPAVYVAEQVRAAREAAGLSTKALAEAMGTSDGAVRRIEDARTNCTVVTLANVAQALGKELVISFK